ncbi:MAG: hypothetical protein RMK19_06175 [Bacteroidia bacterium]|nr:hypothetical protein [Bacteroidia bacterium]MDW8015580.1 hypothetical protein [Bacteroidia bacterium]
MRLSQWLVVVLSLGMVASGIGMLALHRKNQTLNQQVQRLTHLVEERPIELAAFMQNYERFLVKLYQSGAMKNWKLADFYCEELEEAAEQLEKLNLSDDGVPVSAMIRPNLIMPLEKVKEAIQKEDPLSFQQSLSSLVIQCNSCHAAAGKPYIRFSLPQSDTPPRQLFSVSADI